MNPSTFTVTPLGQDRMLTLNLMDLLACLQGVPDQRKRWGIRYPLAVLLAHITNNHGRLEERRITVSSSLQDYSDWPYLAQVFKGERIVWRADKATSEVRYDVTSLPATVADAARLLTIARPEWGIENGLHYRRGVSLAEDARRLRRGHGPHVMATLNDAVISLVLANEI